MITLKKTCLLAVTMLTLAATSPAGEPLKIFILAGQSNMQGTAELRTLKGIGMDPKTKPLYDKLMDKDGNPRVYKDVSIVYFDGKPDDPLIRHGELTAGFGARTRAGDKTGLEFAFGATMYEKLQQPILIIKTAWGGKDLYGDFRPPSAGPIFPDHGKVEPRKTNRGMMPPEERIARAEKKQHVYYNAMVKHVNSVLADPGKYSPLYDKDAGYEIAGFAWFQGFNDMIQSGEDYYKATEDQPPFAYYTELLAHFIRDVRKEFEAPKMPFVIGIIGIGGENIEQDSAQGNLRRAMAAPAEMPEFKGNVAAVHTGQFWDHKIGQIQGIKEQDRTPEQKAYLEANRSNATLHYLGSAKTYSQIGEALAGAVFRYNRAHLLEASEHGKEGVQLTWRKGKVMPTSGRIYRDGKEIGQVDPAKGLYVDTDAPDGWVDYRVEFTLAEGGTYSLETKFPGRPGDFKGEWGILDMSANDGINPGTSEPWRVGDAYRLIFVSSEKSKGVVSTADLTVYDKFVTDLAKKAGIGGTWKVLAGSTKVGAKKHTDTDPETAKYIPVYLIDGKTVVANNYEDLWGRDGNVINRTETGEVLTEGFVATGAVPWAFGRGKGVIGGNLAKGPEQWWKWKRRGDGHLYAISEVLHVKSAN